MHTHRLLLVSYLFPPHGGIAVQRALSMAKYLPRHGFEVHVLTARNAAAPVYDQGLLKHVPPIVKIHTAMTLEVPFSIRHRAWSIVSGLKRGASKQAKPDRAEQPGKPPLPL